MNRWGALVAALCLALTACSSPSRVTIIPTLAELPTSTPELTDTPISTPTSTASATLTPLPATETPTATPTLTNTPTASPTMPRDSQLETMQAEFTQLNATIFTLMTATPTTAPTATQTPQPAILPMDPQQFSTRGESEIRACPSRGCAMLATLPDNSVISVDALIYGEEVDFGNALWYRVPGSGGTTGYVFSAGLIPLPPTLPGTINFSTLPPANVPTEAQAQNPISLPVDPSLCPSADAHCSTLQTCEQARACLAAGNRSLDRDGDGIPCEALCAGQ